MAKHFCCPQCGNKELQVTTETNSQTTGKNYSGGQGCLGFLLFGPLGLLCGLCGQGKQTTTTNTTYWVCPKCGKKFRHPDELRKEAYAKSTPYFPVMCVLGAVFAVVWLIIFGGISMEVAFMAAVVTFVVFALIGFAAKKASDGAQKKAGEELRRLEADMNRFKDE